jgi:hypothetical protein
LWFQESETNSTALSPFFYLLLFQPRGGIVETSTQQSRIKKATDFWPRSEKEIPRKPESNRETEERRNFSPATLKVVNEVLGKKP